MSSVAENKHRIAVNARVRDNSGGSAFALALKIPQGTTVNPSKLKTQLKSGQLTTGHMVNLGTFGSEFTTVSGNVEHYYGATGNSFDTDSLPQTLTGYDETSNAGEYHVYLIVRDIFNNIVVQPHPSNPIQMKSDTIEVVKFDGYFLSTDATTQRQYAEYRAGASNPQVTQQNTHDMFDFYNARTDKLYANVTIHTHESVVNNVRLVAFATSYDLSNTDHVNRIASFAADKFTSVYNDNTDNLFGETGYDAMGEKGIEKVFSGYDDLTAGSNIAFGNVYHVYSVMQDLGFGKPVVGLIQPVTTGVAPVLSGLSASIAETS